MTPPYTAAHVSGKGYNQQQSKPEVDDIEDSMG